MRPVLRAVHQEALTAAALVRGVCSNIRQDAAASGLCIAVLLFEAHDAGVPRRSCSSITLFIPLCTWCAGGGRAAIQRNAIGLAKTLGASAPALLAVVQDPPAGSLPLVLQALHVLTEAAIPPQLMVTACLQLYDSCKDARALVPALRGVDRATALRLLPALLDLQPEQLRPALQRLVAPLAAAIVAGSGGEQAASMAPVAAPAVVSPAELLSALHTLDHSRDSSLLRKMMQGVTVCISSPALFPPESLAACISQLLTRVPLPQLFMRTVIQTVAAAPRLRTFVVGILRQVCVCVCMGGWVGWVGGGDARVEPVCLVFPASCGTW